jgi:hypothetical protein
VHSVCTLARSASENPVFNSILEVTEEKLITWIDRVYCRFTSKVQETVSKQKAPNLRNQAASYRDPDPMIVRRAACIFTKSRPTMQATLTPKRMKDVSNMFYRGALACYLDHEAKLLRKDFKFEDLGYLRTTDSCGVPMESMESEVQESSMIELAKRDADFKYASEILKVEQLAWRRFLTDLKTWDGQNSAEIATFRERLADAFLASASDVMRTAYHIGSVPSIASAGVFASSALQAFADSTPACPPGDVLRVTVWNLPMLGQLKNAWLQDWL